MQPLHANNPAHNNNPTHKNGVSNNDASPLPTQLIAQYQQIRQQSLSLSRPLSEADMCIQSMTDASPTRWHLAHTTWFFETFILKPYDPDYQPLCESYNYLFNSYYNGIGKQFPRAQRGTQTRPSMAEIRAYRQHVDRHMTALLSSRTAELQFLVLLGLNHEQQHQELMLTDIKHAFSLNPAYPAYQETSTEPTGIESNDVVNVPPEPISWLEIPEGVYDVGYQGTAFCYDNEKPRHKTFIQPVSIASRPVNNREYLAFIEAGGYQNAELWLADGWDWLQQESVECPLYWLQQGTAWYEFTLNGLQLLNPDAPVTHISYYEASAFAAWSGKRLPTEFEWEVAAGLHAPDQPQGNLVESNRLHPQPPSAGNHYQFWGDTWEWTLSSYAPYPGFKPFTGNAGEYNGKFMCNQYVLRGGSCATSSSHIRSTYRNFFYPHQRWQFTGIRLLQDR